MAENRSFSGSGLRSHFGSSVTTSVQTVATAPRGVGPPRRGVRADELSRAPYCTAAALAARGARFCFTASAVGNPRHDANEHFAAVRWTPVPPSTKADGAAPSARLTTGHTGAGAQTTCAGTRGAVPRRGPRTKALARARTPQALDAAPARTLRDLSYLGSAHAAPTTAATASLAGSVDPRRSRPPSHRSLPRQRRRRRGELPPNPRPQPKWPHSRRP